MIVIILFLFVVSLLILFIKIKNMQKSNPKIDGEYLCDNQKFIVHGRKNKFTISSHTGNEFLVKNGIIVACKNPNYSTKIIYYKENAKENVNGNN